MDAKAGLIQKIQQFQTQFNKTPELGWQEFKTSAYIQSVLGNPTWKSKTALVYELDGPGEPIGLRAELDALDTSEGPKHVCGHDAHAAALMGVYLYWSERPRPRKLVFIFQPSEETYPSGAKFIQDNYPGFEQIESIIGFHTYPSDNAGELIVPRFAACDYFEISLSGPTTHIKNKYQASTPDLISLCGKLGAQINQQSWVKAIINVGTMTAGSAPNSLAGQAILAGDIRSLSPRAQTRANDFLTKLCASYSAKVDLTLMINASSPGLTNDPRLLKKAQTILPIKSNLTSFATEDFAWFDIPYLYLLIGTGETTELHELNYRAKPAVTQKLYETWVELVERW